MSFDFETFQGEARPLKEKDIPRIAHLIGTGEDEIRAFMEVEAAGSGFDSEGRPKMLFEPHVFYRNLSGDNRSKAVAEGLAYRSWGEQPYPSDSYPRIKQAMEIDKKAALLSASWGAGQILGTNFSIVGYASIEQMVNSFMDDEEEHIEAMIKFILANSIDDDIRAHRWATVARVYNGPGYKKWGYHTKLAKAFRKWQGVPDIDWSPDQEDTDGPGIENGEELKQVQRRLRELGYSETGAADGKWGTRTRAAVLGFRADKGLPIYAGVDDDLLAALMVSGKREISPERRNATVEDLYEKGSRTIKEADASEKAGKATLGLGLIAGAGETVNQLSDQLDVMSGIAAKIAPLQEFFLDNVWLILIAVGGVVVWKSGLIKKWRLFDHQEGKNAGAVD